MPSLKPSQAVTVAAIAATAIGGTGLTAELVLAHPLFAALWGLGWAMVANVANAVGPYLASIND